MLTKKRGGNRKKERRSRYASLCGGGDLLKALGSVALFLANGILYRTNDTHPFSSMDERNRLLLCLVDERGVGTFIEHWLACSRVS